jgi:hypothetical protein
MNNTKKAIENQYSSTSTRVTGTISQFDKRKIDKLRKAVEKALDKIKTDSNDNFIYYFSQQQHTLQLAFKVTRGFIPTNDLAIIQKKFPGATIPPYDKDTGQVLLIPKSLANDYDDEETSDSSDNEDFGTRTIGVKKSNSRPKWTIYAELVFWILVVCFISFNALRVLWVTAMAYIDYVLNYNNIGEANITQ